MNNEKKSPLPIWLSLSVAELRCLLNLMLPTLSLTKAFRLRWFWWRRQQRFRAIATCFQIDFNLLLRSTLPP